MHGICPQLLSSEITWPDCAKLIRGLGDCSCGGKRAPYALRSYPLSLKQVCGLIMN